MSCGRHATEAPPSVPPRSSRAAPKPHSSDSGWAWTFIETRSSRSLAAQAMCRHVPGRPLEISPMVNRRLLEIPGRRNILEGR